MGSTQEGTQGGNNPPDATVAPRTLTGYLRTLPRHVTAVYAPQCPAAFTLVSRGRTRRCVCACVSSPGRASKEKGVSNISRG